MVHLRDAPLCPVSQPFATPAGFAAASRGARHAAWLS
jgi:hypothetical protein